MTEENLRKKSINLAERIKPLIKIAYPLAFCEEIVSIVSGYSVKDFCDVEMTVANDIYEILMKRRPAHARAEGRVNPAGEMK